MKVAVWDTYVSRKDGSIMHFDIIAPEDIQDPITIHQYGKEYLKTKGQEAQPLTSKECRFCHIENGIDCWAITWFRNFETFFFGSLEPQGFGNFYFLHGF